MHERPVGQALGADPPEDACVFGSDVCTACPLAHGGVDEERLELVELALRQDGALGIFDRRDGGSFGFGGDSVPQALNRLDAGAGELELRGSNQSDALEVAEDLAGGELDVHLVRIWEVGRSLQAERVGVQPPGRHGDLFLGDRVRRGVLLEDARHGEDHFFGELELGNERRDDDLQGDGWGMVQHLRVLSGAFASIQRRRDAVQFCVPKV